MAELLMYVTDDDKQNYPFCRFLKLLDSQLTKPTIHNSLKAPKLLCHWIRKLWRYPLRNFFSIFFNLVPPPPPQTAQCPFLPAYDKTSWMNYGTLYFIWIGYFINEIYTFLFVHLDLKGLFYLCYVIFFWNVFQPKNKEFFQGNLTKKIFWSICFRVKIVNNL